VFISVCRSSSLGCGKNVLSQKNSSKINHNFSLFGITVTGKVVQTACSCFKPFI